MTPEETRAYDRAWKKKWRDENPEKAKEQDRQRYLRQRERRLAYQSRYRKDNPDKVLAANRASYQKSEKQRARSKSVTYEKYGLTADDVKKMYGDQGGLCKICYKPLRSPDDLSFRDRKHHEMNIDHCHTSGAVRGLLCGQCNMGLGCFVDSCDALTNAIAYLENAPLYPGGTMMAESSEDIEVCEQIGPFVSDESAREELTNSFISVAARAIVYNFSQRKT